MILTISDNDGLLTASADRHVPRDSRTTDDGSSGPGNPNPLMPRGPRDLNRSRRIGLSRTVCTVCGAIRDQGLTLHKPGCTADELEREFDTPKWRREETDPIPKNMTSKHTGWHTAG